MVLVYNDDEDDYYILWSKKERVMEDLVVDFARMLIHLGMSKNIIDKNRIYLEEAISEDGIDLKDFNRFMNKCIYDFDNQQYDIKLYKKWDFEGCYIIYNIDKDIYHIGRSTKVLYKVDRNFRGYGNKNVYKDYLAGDRFRIRLIPNEYDDYESTRIVESELKEEYGEYVLSESYSQHRLDKEKEKWIREDERKNNNNKLAIIVVIMCFIVFIFCIGMMFYEFNEKEINRYLFDKTYSGSEIEYRDKNYKDVKHKLKEYGFKNVKTVDLDDAGLKIWKNEKVESVLVDNVELEDNEEDYSKIEQVIIYYH